MSRREPVVLAIDAGTSSVRASCYDAAGRALPGVFAQRSYTWVTTQEGGMETGLEALFEQVALVVDETLAAADEAGVEIVAVATTTFWHGVAGLDDKGAPLTPLFGWGDTRAADAAAALGRALDSSAVHRRTGCFVHASYPTAKLLWLGRTRNESFRRVSTWGSIGEYLAQRLFGARATSWSMASGTGLLDSLRGAWDDEVCAAVGVRVSQLPELRDDDGPLRGLRPEFARRWPALAQVPWMPVLGDGACANVGSGAVGVRAMGLTVGTSAALRVVWTPTRGEQSAPPDCLWSYLLDRRRRVTGGALSNGGNTVAFFERLLRVPPGPEREAALEAMSPDAHGLTIVPALVGERSPAWHPDATAAVVGLTQDTEALQVLRAAMEAVAVRIAGVYDDLVAAFGVPDRVLSGGGALHASAAWRRMIADALGRPLMLSGVRETSARGAALVALEHLGLIGDVADAPAPVGEEIASDPAHHARYRAARARQHELEALLMSGRPQGKRAW